MSIEVTDEAIEVLKNSLSLMNSDPSSTGVRLRGARALGGGFEIQVEFSERAEETDTIVEKGGIRVFVASEVLGVYPEALVTVDPMHDIVTVRPA